MKRMAILAAGLLAACGGGGGGGGNAAASKTFTYPSTGSPAPSSSVSDASSAVSAALAFDASPSAAAAADVYAGLFGAASEALGDGSLFSAAGVDRIQPLARSLRARALSPDDLGGSGLPAGCGVVAGGTVTFDPARCAGTEALEGGGSVSWKLAGSVAGARGAATWDLAVDVTVTDAGLSATARLDDDGNLAVAGAAATGQDRASLDVRLTADGQGFHLAVAQAIDLDLVLDQACATKVVDGTFEARRVWTAVPQEARDDPEMAEVVRDRGVKLDWSGCGQATAFFSAN